MARLPAVAEIFARHDTRSLPTINNYARELRNAGYLSKGKRGVGAAHLTPADAANLVMAIASAPEATNGPFAIETLRSAKLDPEVTVDGGVEMSSAEVFAKFGLADAVGTLGGLLETLISAQLVSLDGTGQGVTALTLRLPEVVPGIRSAIPELEVIDDDHILVFKYRNDLDAPGRIGAGRPDRGWIRTVEIDLEFFADLGICVTGDLAAHGAVELSAEEAGDIIE